MDQIQGDVESQISLTIDGDEISDSGSVCDETSPFGLFTGDVFVQIGEGSLEHGMIKRSFLTGMGSVAKYTNVVAIHKNSLSTLTRKARLESFQLFSEAVAEKCGGDANVRLGWFGGTRDEILGIVKHGFSHCGRRPVNGQSYGVGVHLASTQFSIDGALSSDVDEDGLKHILLCRVIMGNMEVICPGSNQFHPSSQNFDSGVDNLLAPRRYIVWSANMNSHIFPIFIISFKVPTVNDFLSVQANVPKPRTSLMTFSALISILSRFLNPPKMALIDKSYNDFRGNKITKPQFINSLRLIAGDGLLLEVLKPYTQERSKMRQNAN
ncbi:probable inactive poly [ADP-ribose] polymerase SRO2 [Quercus suber]|uniref:probable inactive poly [ADP-ribose] polymerase SRO2 n=1 Tax=Quercus suber TaxID=58331 RepID=UPI000CE1D1DA|nr:probable inactive poly [ADP-ribose] polymerase SRO2 [Quercus suber]XP_023877924.1 probable inactive poly [ADP-ribose] polymerase SRO2 [Quercus suber]POF27220.1 putative inactive poly [adp-ribose] polymerase sro2 [Quercus suber]